MGRGLSELQNRIICKLGQGKILTQDYVLTNFYDFQKRAYCYHGQKIGFYEWYKDGEKVKPGGLYGNDVFFITKNGALNDARVAFCHSVQNLRKRGLIQGSGYNLSLTEPGRQQLKNLSINAMVSLIDKPTVIRIEQSSGGGRRDSG